MTRYLISNFDALLIGLSIGAILMLGILSVLWMACNSPDYSEDHDYTLPRKP